MADPDDGTQTLQTASPPGSAVEQHAGRRLASASNTPERAKVRVTKERQRVSRACDECKRKKARCNGTLPCAPCVKGKLECNFNASYNRGSGRPPTPPPGVFLDSGDTMTIGPVSSLDRRRPSISMPESRSSPAAPGTMTSQTDSHGHYMGSSSGISFLTRARYRLQRLQILQVPTDEGPSSIFTFGDTPLPKFDATRFVLPQREEATRLVSRYFEWGMPTYRFLHAGTVKSWQNRFYDDPQESLDDDLARGRNAVLFMVFAIAEKSLSGDRQTSLRKAERSLQYYQAAEKQLAGETGQLRLASIQARLCQCFYLMSISCVNQAWILFGTVTRLVYALGLHRKSTKLGPISMDSVEAECRKRTFFCAYTLDRYLSSMMGRPCTFHDSDLDQQIPDTIDDLDLSTIHLHPQGLQGRRAQCEMTASVAHIQLGKLVSNILQSLYGLKPCSEVEFLKRAGDIRLALTQWTSALPAYLNPAQVDPCLLQPLWQRQSTMLTIAVSHARILAFRPLLIESKTLDTTLRSTNAELADESISAALTVVGVVEDLAKRNEFKASLWFTQYVAFTAVVVLYMHSIQVHAEEYRARSDHFRAAAACAEHLRTVALPQSLASRYVSVIDALHIEATASTIRAPTADKTSDGDMSFPQPHRRHLQSQHGPTLQDNSGQAEISSDLFTPNLNDQQPILDQQLDWATFFNSAEADANVGANDWMDFDALVLGTSTFPV